MFADLKILRPVNCIMGVVGVILGALVGIGHEIFSFKYAFELSLGMMIAFFFMAAGNMMNDYFDRDLDRINHPDRPIPSGRVQAKDVITAAGLIYVLLIILGFLVNLTMLLILIVAMLLMIGYEVWLKRKGFIGNITISILVALLFIFGAATVLKFDVVILLSVLAFLATLTREIVKDIEDLAGDVDRVSLPKKIGVGNASIVAGIFLTIAVVLSPLPVLPEYIPFLGFEKLSIYYIYIIIPADILFIMTIIYFQRNPSFASQALKGGMAVALAAFVLGSLGI